MPKHWTDRQLELLQTHWREPDASLSKMAAAINAATGARFTRNAIAGQAKRLGLPLRRSPNRNKGPRPASPRPATRIVAVNLRRRKARPVIAVPDEITYAGAPPHLGLTLIELNDTTCRYPRGTDRFSFCGQPAEPGRAYCGFHLRLCYAPLEGRASTTQRRAA
jgi:GcrA cell cycle regulator